MEVIFLLWKLRAIEQYQTTIKISNYYNLFSDHKRNKFEKIIIEKKVNEILPFRMFIFFDVREKTRGEKFLFIQKHKILRQIHALLRLKS